ncbi:MAG: aminoacyl-tRNA hydrolase [Simkaniaceae bacterium]|nr:aminoacyl-tRNA hydrolase [Simkaniaceae bacterium]
MAKHLIIGLGNPGARYEKTRHNVGFEVVKAFAQSRGMTFKRESQFLGELAKGGSILALLPQTYMNLSGDSAARVVNFYKPDEVLVVFDDADLAVGKMRLRFGGGSGGHNGIKSLVERLGSGDFARLRIGIGRSQERDLASYVLEKFDTSEMKPLIDLSVETIEEWITSGVTDAADSLGKKLKEKFNGSKRENAPLRGDVHPKRDVE